MITASERVLDTGLRLVVVHRPHVHTASIGAFVRVGTRNEHPSEQGLAHFLEHLLFRGSEKLADSTDVSRAVERLGGHVDAWVHQEMTAYVVDVHRDHWREGLEILGDVLLQPTFRDEQVRLERAIVDEEMGQYADSHGENVNLFELVYHLLWGSDVAQSDLGRLRRNLTGFDRDTVLDFYRRHYTAGNMVVVIVGDVDPEEALARASKLFARVPGGRGDPYKNAATRANGAESVFRFLDTTQVDAVIGLRSVSIRDPDYPAAAVLSEILGGGSASRLFTEVRERRGLVYDVRSEVVTFRDVGAIMLSTYCSEQNVEQTLSAIFDVLLEVWRNGVSEEELDRARRLVRATADYILDSPIELAEWYGRILLLDEPAALPDPRRVALKYAAVDMADVARVARPTLAPMNRYMALLGPMKSRQKKRLESLFRDRTRVDTVPDRGGA